MVQTMSVGNLELKMNIAMTDFQGTCRIIKPVSAPDKMHRDSYSLPKLASRKC